MVTNKQYLIRDRYTFNLNYSVFMSMDALNNVLRSSNLSKVATLLRTGCVVTLDGGVTCSFTPTLKGVASDEAEALLQEVLIKRLLKLPAVLEHHFYSKSLVLCHETTASETRTLVADYVLNRLGVYRCVEARWITSDYDDAKHWAKVQAAVPFELDVLTFKGKGDVDETATYRFDVVKYSPTLTKKPVEFESQVLTIKIDYDETTWTALRALMRLAVESSNALLPSFKLDVKALDALLNNR